MFTGWVVVAWSKKSYLGLVEISSPQAVTKNAPWTRSEGALWNSWLEADLK